MIELDSIAIYESIENEFLFLKNKSIKENQAFIFDYILSNHQDLEVLKISSLITKFDLWPELASLQDSDKLALAKNHASQNMHEFLFRFNDFKIERQDHLVEIAKFCAIQGEESIARNIQELGIASEESRIEIAKLCAEKNVEDTLDNFKNFKITNQSALTEIAEICAKKNVGQTAKHIEKLGIASENRIEIAKILSMKSGDNLELFKLVIGYMSTYLTSESLIEFAKFSFSNKARLFFDEFDSFKIEKEEDRIELVKNCFQNVDSVKFPASHFLFNFDKFNIKNQDALVEIAKMFVKKDLNSTSLYIKKFKIASEESRIEIARLCAEIEGNVTAERIGDFEITNQKVLKEIFSCCVAQNEKALSFAASFILNDDFSELLTCSKEDAKNILLEKFQELSKQIIPYFKKESGFIDFLKCAFLLIGAQSSEVRKIIQEKGILEAYLVFKAPQERWNLLPLLISVPQTLTQLFKPTQTSATVKKGNKVRPEMKLETGNEIKPEMKLLFLLFAHFGFKENNKISSFFTGKWNRHIRDGLSLVFLIKTLRVLKQDQTFTDEQKQAIIVKLMKEGSENLNLKDLVYSLYILLQLNKKETIQDEEAAAWSAKAQEAFQKLVHLDDIGDFSVKYNETFMACRDSEAILVYATQLATLKDEKVMEALGSFVSSVLNGTFKADRYGIKNNPHLATINQQNPALIQFWKEPTIVSDDKLSQDEQLIDTDDPFDIF